MIDDETDLRERFAELRAEERGVVPAFRVARRLPRPTIARWTVATATLLLLVAFASLRRHQTNFSASDRAVARSIAEWHAPTEFLLRTPGREILTTTPQIPDQKGIPR